VTQTQRAHSPTSLADVNLIDLDIFVQGVPHEAFKLLRREAPVFFHPEPDGPGFWALTKYEDVVTVSLDSGTFSSAQGPTYPISPRKLSASSR
jgi:hypothetical protein